MHDDDDDGGEGLFQLPACRIVLLSELKTSACALANAQVRFIGRCAHMPPQTTAALHACRPRVQAHTRVERVRRRLQSLDCAHSTATFEDQGDYLLVETSQLAVSQQPSRVGGVYSIMGEVDLVEPQRREPIVRARLARSIDGMDLALWEQALQIRRQYDAHSVSNKVFAPPC